MLSLILSVMRFRRSFRGAAEANGGRIARALGASTFQSIEIGKHGPAPDFTVGWDGLKGSHQRRSDLSELIGVNDTCHGACATIAPVSSSDRSAFSESALADSVAVSAATQAALTPTPC